jgi:aminopeptidase YwaD
MSVRTAGGRLGCVCVLVSATILLAGCSGSEEDSGDPAASNATPTRAAPTSASATTPRATGASKPSTSPSRVDPPATPPRFRVAAAVRTIRFLAVRTGPREATSPAYRRAADWVEGRFAGYGLDVHGARIHVPAGNSWGVDVDAGTTTNVVATVPDFDPRQPHLVISAHLDTVPQAPGAEDDASGIGVLLELARMAADRETRLPVVFVAFAAEEPRGDGDVWHHFGSRAMVARMPSYERDAVAGMVSMDRVGVGSVVPVCNGASSSTAVRGQLLRTAARVDVPALACTSSSSDHWSFELAGMPAARVGGTSYAAYHSAADLPSVINPAQLARVGRLLWAWIEAR